ncbi:MAG: CehA/McbA family metallohydrolase [Pseudomonadota bacterium]
MTRNAQNPFQRPGTFWRGNLHTHSTRSDGVLPPGDVARHYRGQGYDFLVLSDHFVGMYGYPITDLGNAPVEGLTLVPGAEMHAGAMANGEIWHLVVVGLPPDFTPPAAPDFEPRPDQETAAQLAQRARDAGAFVIVAHPEASQLTLADALSIEAAHAVEIYNHSAAMDRDRGSGLHIAEALLNRGRRLSLTASDDAHFDTPDACGGWVMVRAEDNTPEQLVAALKQGHYYASTGPEIWSVDWGADTVEIEMSPVRTVALQGQGTEAVTRHGDGLTTVSLPYGPLATSPWLRLTAIDAHGKRAWTSPVWSSS